jgi:hypothetical protein
MQANKVDRPNNLPAVLIFCLLLTVPVATAQSLPGPAREKLEALVSTTYEQASAQFPCKVGTRGKAHMLKWQDVDRCLNRAAGSVDWEALSRDLEVVRLTVRNLSGPDFMSQVEASFTAHSVRFDQVLQVKDKKATLPLTNSLLKFLPEHSLAGLRVVDNAGTDVGTFAGLFSFERTGGLSTANSYRLTMFQYTTSSGVAVAPPERLLLDSFGVPWVAAAPQKGFRLTVDKLKIGN